MPTQQASEEDPKHNTLRLSLALLSFIVTVIVIVLYCDNVIPDLMAATFANSDGTIVSYVGWLFPWQVYIRTNGGGRSIGGVKRKADFSLLFLINSDDYGYSLGFMKDLEQAGCTVRSCIWDESKDLSKAIKEEQRKADRVYSIITDSFLDKAKKNAGYHKFKKMHRTRAWRSFFFRPFVKERHTLVCVHKQSHDELRRLRAEMKLELLDLVDMPEATARVKFLSYVKGTVKGSQTDARFPGRQIGYIPPPEPYFTGRQEILSGIRTAFQACRQVVVLHGLKGSGKTQIARAYAQQQKEQYPYAFSLHMSSYKTYEEDLRKIGDCLKLAEKQDADSTSHQSLMPEPVLRQKFLEWLQGSSSSWLLILDDCNDPKYASFFGSAYERGHILLTTSDNRITNSNTFPVKPIPVISMSEEDGALLLLRLTRILDRNANLEQASDQIRRDAEEMSGLLGNRPDALKIAGNYIDYIHGSKDRSSGRCLRDYIELYQKENHHLKEMYADLRADTSKKVVIYPWYLSFEKLQGQAPETAETLWLCSLLGHSAIPIAIIQQALQLDPLYQAKAGGTIWFRNTLGKVLRLSLFEREDELLIINPHVQDFLRGTINTTRYAELTKYVVAATSLAFPEATSNEIQHCKQYVPHVKACEELIAKFALKTIGVTRQYDRYGCYLREMAYYEDARMYLEKGLELYKELLPQVSIQVATSMRHLAELYYAQNDLKKGKDYAQQSLQIQLQTKANTLNIALARSNLAIICEEQGDIEEAKTLHNAIWGVWQEQIEASEVPGEPSQIWKEQIEASEEPFATVNILKRLAYTCHFLGRHDESNKLYNKALDICEREEDAQQTSFPETGICRANLARSYFDQKDQDKYDIAEVYYGWALKLYRNILWDEHPQVAAMHRNLADLDLQQLKDGMSTATLNASGTRRYYNSAFDNYKQACGIYEKVLPCSPAQEYVQRMMKTLREDYPDLWKARKRKQQKQPAKKESRKKTESRH